MKEVKINVPEGHEIDQENSTFECIKLKKKSLPSYDEIQDLARGGSPYISGVHCCPRHVGQLKVYRMLLEVAEYLNEGWEPYLYDIEDKYYICKRHNPYNPKYTHYSIALAKHNSVGQVLFKTEELAKQAIKIIGEKNLDLLFS